jgi:hypothetical protein
MRFNAFVLVIEALRENDVATYRDFLKSRCLNPGTLESSNPFGT